MTLYENSLFIFRRDLRIDDNTALNEALRLSKQVLTCFIFDPRQYRPTPIKANRHKFKIITQRSINIMHHAYESRQNELVHPVNNC